jgi:hypothetical protein
MPRSLLLYMLPRQRRIRVLQWSLRAWLYCRHPHRCVWHRPVIDPNATVYVVSARCTYTAVPQRVHSVSPRYPAQTRSVSHTPDSRLSGFRPGPAAETRAEPVYLTGYISAAAETRATCRTPAGRWRSRRGAFECKQIFRGFRRSSGDRRCLPGRLGQPQPRLGRHAGRPAAGARAVRSRVPSIPAARRASAARDFATSFRFAAPGVRAAPY